MRYKVANLMRRKGYGLNEKKCPEVIEMQKEIASLGSGINFDIKTYPDGMWTAKSTNVDGILTGSRNLSEINELLKDATLTYYGVPSHFAYSISVNR